MSEPKKNNRRFLQTITRLKKVPNLETFIWSNYGASLTRDDGRQAFAKWLHLSKKCFTNLVFTNKNLTPS